MCTLLRWFCYMPGPCFIPGTSLWRDSLYCGFIVYSELEDAPLSIKFKKSPHPAWCLIKFPYMVCLDQCFGSWFGTCFLIDVVMTVHCGLDESLITVGVILHQFPVIVATVLHIKLAQKAYLTFLSSCVVHVLPYQYRYDYVLWSWWVLDHSWRNPLSVSFYRCAGAPYQGCAKSIPWLLVFLKLNRQRRTPILAPPEWSASF